MVAGHDCNGNFYASRVDTGDLLVHNRYLINEFGQDPDPCLDHFVRRLSNKNDPAYDDRDTFRWTMKGYVHVT